MQKYIHPKIIEVTPEELIQFQLRWILHGVINLNDTELMVLSYVYLHGSVAADTIVEIKILSSVKTVENYISKLRKKGLILGTRNNTRIHPDIKPLVKDISYTVKFKIKNDKVDT